MRRRGTHTDFGLVPNTIWAANIMRIMSGARIEATIYSQAHGSEHPRPAPPSVSVTSHRSRWPELTLPGQFLLAGAAVMLVAMVVVGSWVSSIVKATVVQNSAISAAQFVENFISPIGQELVESDELSPPAVQALGEIFQHSAVRDQVISYKIWLPNGQVVHASNPDVIGQVFDQSADFKKALDGQVSASYERLDGEENEAEAELDMPLLEVYMPLRELWTNEVIGVVEFYQQADQLRRDILRARLNGWLVVGATFLASGVLLFGIVQAGGRKIRKQGEDLRRQLELTNTISRQNAELKQRAVTASARAASKSERMLRQLGADLHDGPAQYLSFAALRLDEAFSDQAKAEAVKSEIRHSLDQAMREIRLLSRGLSLPDLDAQSLDTVIRNAVAAHQRRGQMEIELTIEGRSGVSVGYAQKLCAYRFLQEALSNASRHAPDATVSISCKIAPTQIEIDLADNGPGFDPDQALKLRSEGGQGLLGLRDRVESIGGTMDIDATPGRGTLLSVKLPIEEHDDP